MDRPDPRKAAQGKESRFHGNVPSSGPTVRIADDPPAAA
jgi:hypothetical protein